MAKYTQEQLAQMAQLRQEGKGVTEIARIMGLNRGFVSKNLQQMGFSTARNPIIKDIFHTIDTEEKAYWLGMLYADGTVNAIQGQVSLRLNEQDCEHIGKLKAFLQCNNKINYDAKNHSFGLAFCCADITQDLETLGCVPNKSLILTFPSDDQVPAHLKRHFMRGYIDGDGCLCYTDKSYIFSFTSTKAFIDDAIQFFRWKPCKLGHAGQNFTWRCADKKLVPQYLDTLYKDSQIYLDRKYNKYLQMSNIGAY